MSDAAQLVADRIVGKTVIRQMHKGESLPASFELGFDQLGQVDEEWVWVAESGDRLVGCIMASPCHGTAIVWRVVSRDTITLLKLLRFFLKECKTRGLRGCMAMIDPQIDAQRKLKSIMVKTGGNVASTKFELVATPLKWGA